jgi:long-chain fatty acid transport protein
VFYPVAAYLAHQAGDFGLGLGFYSPFGLATEWKDPDNFSGRFISTKAELESFCFNPAVGWNLSERVRLGLGILAVTSSVRLERAVGRPNPTEVGPGVLDLGTVVLDGGSGGLDFGFNAGVQVDVSETITAGVAYRSQVDALLRGDADFTFTGGTPLNPQIAPLFPKDQKAETELPLPDLLVLGLAHRCGASEFEVDLGWQNWADFQALVVRFDDPSLDIERRERWENAWFLRGGWEYALRPDLDLRLGAYYDRSPQPTESISPLLPDNDRWGLSAGLGIAAGSLRADVYGLLLLSPDRSTDGRSIDGYEGTYDSGAVITGLSLGFGF